MLNFDERFELTADAVCLGGRFADDEHRVDARDRPDDFPVIDLIDGRARISAVADERLDDDKVARHADGFHAVAQKGAHLFGNAPLRLGDRRIAETALGAADLEEMEFFDVARNSRLRDREVLGRKFGTKFFLRFDLLLGI